MGRAGGGLPLGVRCVPRCCEPGELLPLRLRAPQARPVPAAPAPAALRAARLFLPAGGAGEGAVGARGGAEAADRDPWAQGRPWCRGCGI